VFLFEDNSSFQALVKNQAVYKGVFNVRLPGTYDWNYDEAKRVCRMFGAALATLQQITEAWKIGFDSCK